MERIVHFDFKGAPLKVPYLEKVFKDIKSWGATGVLLEWEDTFPFSAELSDFGSVGGCGGDGMYSPQEVNMIISCARANELEVIQLVQTIGHLEYVLKHPQCAHLREAPSSPAVLCPTKPDSLRLVCNMLRQVLEMQPDAKFIHIGADEVWHTGVCLDCQRKASTHQHNKAALFLDHIQEVVLYVKRLLPNVTVLIWDDMLHPMSLDTMQAYKLGELVTPVIWKYDPLGDFVIDPLLWDKYMLVFNDVWAASAFKGASGSNQVAGPEGRYLSNQAAWRREISQKSGVIRFAGIILTGWSRYDHYATLCELLPTSLPALYLCMKVWTRPDTDIEALLQQEWSMEWSGARLATCVRDFVTLREKTLKLLNNDAIGTWLNPWQIQSGYTNPEKLHGVAEFSRLVLNELKGLRTETNIQLQLITGPRSTQEWLGTYLDPLIKKMEDLYKIASERACSYPCVRPKIEKGDHFSNHV